MKVNNLAQLKLYLKNNIGNYFELSNYRIDQETKELILNWKPPARKLTLVNSVSFGFETLKPDNTLTTSYCYYPKASQINFVNNDKELESFSIKSGDNYALVYSLVKHD